MGKIAKEQTDADEAPLTDEELAELALAAGDPEPEPQEKQGFWKRWF